MTTIGKLNCIFATLAFLGTWQISDSYGTTIITDAFSPHQGATELIVSTINSAKNTIMVAAYSFTSKPIAIALVNARAR